MMENNQNEINNVNQKNEEWFNILEEPTKKRSKLKMFIFVFLIVLIVSAGVIGVHYFFTITNPKTIFIKASDMFFESVKERINESEDAIKHSYFYKGDAKINTNIPDASILDNQVFNYSFGIDLTKEKIEAGFGILENDKNILSLNSNIKNNNVYLDLGELFNKVILLDEDIVKENVGMSIDEIFDLIKDVYSEENIEDINYIINKLHEMTNQALSKVKYEKVKEKININDNSLSVSKISLNMNYDNLKIIALTYIDGMLKDDKLIEKLAKLSYTDKYSIKESLRDAKEEINSEISEEKRKESLFKISVFTTGLKAKVVKLAIEQNNEELVYCASYKEYKVIAGDDYSVEINKDKLVVKESGQVVMRGTVRSLETDNLDIDFKAEDNTLEGNIKYVSKDSNSEVEVKLVANESEKAMIHYLYKSKKVNNKETDMDLSLSIEYADQNLKFESNIKEIIDGDIANINDANTKNINDLTEEDLNTILENLMEAIKGTKFEELVFPEENSYVLEENNSIINSAI